MLSLFEVCKLVTNDIAMKINPDIVFENFKDSCINATLTEFTCDVIERNWDSLWKQMLDYFMNCRFLY
jgi:hypothetical protein